MRRVYYPLWGFEMYYPSLVTGGVEDVRAAVGVVDRGGLCVVGLGREPF